MPFGSEQFGPELTAEGLRAELLTTSFGSFYYITISYVVPGVGVEPTNPFGSRILSPLRKPFRHPGITSYQTRTNN